MKKIILGIVIFFIGLGLGIFISLNYFQKNSPSKKTVSISPSLKKEPTLPPPTQSPKENDTITSSPTSIPITQTKNESLPIIRIPYQPKTDWTTYKDDIAGFSFQYNNIPTGEYNSYQKINKYEFGKNVEVYSCFTPKAGPSANQDVCNHFYNLSVYNNYDGGSRRLWFMNNFKDMQNCNMPKYYTDVYVDNIKGLLVTSECGSSWGNSYFLFPKGKTMIVLNIYYFFVDEQKNIKIDESFYRILSTFKFY